MSNGNDAGPGTPDQTSAARVYELEGKLRDAKKDLAYLDMEKQKLSNELELSRSEAQHHKQQVEYAREDISMLHRRMEEERLRKAPIGIIGNVIIIGNIISGAAGIIIILSVICISMFSASEVPKVLENWGGIVLGFYFGSFMGLIKDFMARAPVLAEEERKTHKEQARP